MSNTQFDIVKMVSAQKTDRLLAKAQELASNMVESAKAIAKAAAEGDLVRLAWLTRSYDAALAATLDAHHENLHLINGLESNK